MRFTHALLLASLASSVVTGCARDSARASTAFDSSKFVATALQISTADVDLGAVAAKRGRLPETRALGAMLLREQSELKSALTALAQRKKVAPPEELAQKQLARRDNLETLAGQVFDRGYSLGMVQDLNALIASFEKAEKSDDPELAALAKQYLPRLSEQRKAASRVLDQLGGSPFEYPP
jgi:predicted outer membrane protein